MSASMCCAESLKPIGMPPADLAHLVGDFAKVRRREPGRGKVEGLIAG